MPETVSATTIRYALMPSPIGPLLVAAIGDEIIQVAFENQNFQQVLDQLHTKYGLDAERDDHALAFATSQLEEYFAGTRTSFDLPLRRQNPEQFITRVQQHLVTIPYGQTRTYGQLATELDKTGAARAVGSACATNPLPIIVPCHRVVRSDGSLGGYRGGLEIKRTLLALEQDFSVG